MKFFLILGLIVFGLGYYFRDDLPGWTGADPNAKLSLPSAAHSIGRQGLKSSTRTRWL